MLSDSGPSGDAAAENTSTGDAHTMTPALYALIDRSRWAVDQPIGDAGLIAWDIFGGGVRAFADAKPTAFAALQYLPYKRPGSTSNEADPLNYTPPVIDFGLLTDPAAVAAIDTSIDSMSRVSEFPMPLGIGYGATKAAIDYTAAWQAKHPETKAGVVLVWNYSRESVTQMQMLLWNTQVPVFVVTSPWGFGDWGAATIAGAQDPNRTPYVIQTAGELAAAMSDIAKTLKSL